MVYGCQCLGIFNARTDVDACDCTRGLYGHRKRVCTESRIREKSPLPHQGLEPASVSPTGFLVGRCINWTIPVPGFWPNDVNVTDCLATCQIWGHIGLYAWIADALVFNMSCVVVCPKLERCFGKHKILSRVSISSWSAACSECNIILFSPLAFSFFSHA